MSELFPPTLEEVIAEVEREIAMRKRVYPNFIARGSMTERRSERQIALMQEALRLLREHQ